MREGLRFAFVVALLALTMSFSYGAGSNPPIDYPRMLISDTTQLGPQGQRVYAFEDSEIMAAYQIESFVWQSSMTYSGTGGVNQFSPPPNAPYRRVAATLLDCLASNQARLAIVSGILDVKINGAAAKQMQDQAKYLRQVDDESGAFVIIEQVNDWPSFRDRWWKTVQRQMAF
jgi:hypothetical protein